VYISSYLDSAQGRGIGSVLSNEETGEVKFRFKKTFSGEPGFKKYN